MNHLVDPYMLAANYGPVLVPLVSPPASVSAKRAPAFDPDDVELKRAPTSTMMAASGQATAGRPERR